MGRLDWYRAACSEGAGLVARQLGLDRDGIAGGRTPPRAQIFTVDVDGRARWIRFDPQDGDVWRNALDGLLNAADGLLVCLAVESVDIVAICVGELLELLVRARDVEDDIAVGHEAIRGEEVFERDAELALGIGVDARFEVEIGFVGIAVRIRQVHAQRREQDGSAYERNQRAPSAGQLGITSRNAVVRHHVRISRCAEQGARYGQDAPSVNLHEESVEENNVRRKTQKKLHGGAKLRRSTEKSMTKVWRLATKTHCRRAQT